MLRLATMSEVERGQLEAVAGRQRWAISRRLCQEDGEIWLIAIVLTGGDKPVVSRLASDLWVLGANVLVTFTELSAMEQFAARITRSQIEEWARVTVSKCSQVDCLVNFVDDDDEKPKADAAVSSEDTTDETRATSQEQRGRDAVVRSHATAGAVPGVLLGRGGRPSTRSRSSTSTTFSDTIHASMTCAASRP
ncbi:hypothetical protein PINS_up017402 [Pythium insidiosum]|nr:hypothetical protein PINS_up017402 [Pythium insidiosum]